MLERWLEVYVPVDTTLAPLARHNLVITEPEVLQARELVSLLGPFDAVTKTLSGELYPTLSLVYPMVQRLLYGLHHTQVRDPVMVDLKARFLFKIQNRWIASDIMMLSCALDPRTKNGGPFWNHQQTNR
jgi:hypothetical protein